MRIPFAQADWPHAFNKLAKYLGRHSDPKLPLSAAREKLAQLSGYNSVHEVRKTLIKAHDESAQYPVEKMIRAMLLRALIRFDESPNDAITVYSRLPLNDLALWPHTDRYKEQVWLESMRSQGKMIVLDEFGYYANGGVFSTPETMAYMIERFNLPRYTKAVRSDGSIFISELLASEIRRLSDREAIETLLADEFPTLLFDTFIERYLLPRAWQNQASLKAHLMQDDSPEYTQLVPDYIKVEQLIDGRFALYHQGIHAYFQITLSHEELADQVLPLWLGQAINGDSALSAEVRCKPDIKALRSGCHPTLKKGTGVLLGECEELQFDGLSYRRTQPIMPYHQGFLEWITAQVPTNRVVESLNTEVLDETIYQDHQKISQWKRMNASKLGFTQAQYNTLFKQIDFTDLKVNLARVSEQLECDPDYIEEANELIEAYPIIGQHFSVAQVTLLIEEITERTLYGTERHALLLLAEGLMASTNTYLNEYSAIDIMLWMVSERWRSLKEMTWDQLKTDWIIFHQIWTQHDRQQEWIGRIEDFLSRDIDPHFLNHSTDKIRTSRHQTMTDLMMMCRKMNLQITNTTQSIQDFS
jgi:hypothetical protein